jgi:hypothetical protein
VESRAIAGVAGEEHTRVGAVEWIGYRAATGAEQVSFSVLIGIKEGTP